MEHVCFNSVAEFKAHRAMLSFMYIIKKVRLLKGAVHILAKPRLLPQL
jgi:hypothetical protein